MPRWNHKQVCKKISPENVNSDLSLNSNFNFNFDLHSKNNFNFNSSNNNLNNNLNHSSHLINKRSNFKKIPTQKTSNGNSNENLKLTDIISNNSSLKCYYTNATSLCNKFEELELIAKTDKPDIIFITETWFCESFSPSLSGYESYCHNRKDRRGGGVCIFINQSFKSYEVQDPTLCDDDVEQKWCGLVVSSRLIL